MISDDFPFGLHCAATEWMVLESVIEKLLAVLKREEGTLVERVVPLAHRVCSCVTRLPSCVQDLVVHVKTRIRR